MRRHRSPRTSSTSRRATPATASPSRLDCALATQWVYSSRIKTPTTHFDLTVIHQAGTTQASLTKGAGQTLVTCDGLSQAVDPAQHVVAVKVPAECLGSPAWVQVGAGMVVLPKAGGTTYADDALRKAGVREKHLTLSNRLESDGIRPPRGVGRRGQSARS